MADDVAKHVDLFHDDLYLVEKSVLLCVLLSSCRPLFKKMILSLTVQHFGQCQLQEAHNSTQDEIAGLWDVLHMQDHVLSLQSMARFSSPVIRDSGNEVEFEVTLLQ